MSVCAEISGGDESYTGDIPLRVIHKLDEYMDSTVVRKHVWVATLGSS